MLKDWLQIINYKQKCEINTKKAILDGLVLFEIAVDLLVRSWVEINPYIMPISEYRVDLLVRSWVEISIHRAAAICFCGRPPREVVSWNEKDFKADKMKDGRPPREVVSWNAERTKGITTGLPSTTSWGGELK